MILLKFGFVIVFSLLQGSSFSGFKILVLVIFSTLSFTNYYFIRPYYNHRMNDVNLAFSPFRF